MKKVSVIIMLALATTCYSQSSETRPNGYKVSGDTVYSNSLLHVIRKDSLENIYYDTTAAVFVVSANKNACLKSTEGFIVRMHPGVYFRPEIIKYLDKKRKPLPECYIVWQTINP